MKKTFLSTFSLLALTLLLVTFGYGSGIVPAAYNLVQNAGTPLARRTTINFTGAGVTASDSGGVTTVTIAGGTGGSGNYSQSFVTQTSVVLTHSLATVNVVVSCYDGSNIAIIPNTTTVTNANNVTVTFSPAQTGYCVVNGNSSPPATVYNQTIQDEGVSLTQRAIVNMVGAGVTCVDSGGKTVCTIAGGGGGGVAVGTYAALPACSTTVFLYEVLSSPLSAVCDGASTYQWRVGGMAIPNLISTANFSFVNTGTATWANSAAGPMTVTQPQNALTPLRLASQTPPATPYTVTAYLSPAGGYFVSGGQTYAGIYARNSGTGKLEAYYSISSAISGGVDGGIYMVRWNDANTCCNGSGNGVTDLNWVTNQLVGLRVANDGTNLTYSYSLNGGVTWNTTFTSAIATHLTTVNDIGFVFANIGSSNQTATGAFYSFIAQ